MSLSSDQIAFVGNRADWYFEVLYPLTGANGDWTTFVGTGLADINSFIGRYETTPTMRVMVDVGTLSSSLQTATIQDIRDIRTVFVAAYGSVNRVSPYNPSLAFPIVQDTGTKWIENLYQPTVQVT